MIINNKTSKLLDSFINNPNSSLIIFGDRGTGLDIIAKETAKKITKSESNIIEISPVNNIIGIETIRDLKKHFTTNLGTADVSRIAIINQANLMTKQAQNAALKIIEEPLNNSVLIITGTNTNNILPTIISRCQIINILPISKDQGYKYARSLGISEVKTDAAFILSKGYFLDFDKYLTTESIKDEFVQSAKSFLSFNYYRRIESYEQYSTTTKIKQLISSLEQISEAAMHNSKNENINNWKQIIKNTMYCKNMIENNAPNKLVYLRLCVNI